MDLDSENEETPSSSDPQTFPFPLEKGATDPRLARGGNLYENVQQHRPGPGTGSPRPPPINHAAPNSWGAPTQPYHYSESGGCPPRPNHWPPAHRPTHTLPQRPMPGPPRLPPPPIFTSGYRPGPPPNFPSAMGYQPAPPDFYNFLPPHQRFPPPPPPPPPSAPEYIPLPPDALPDKPENLDESAVEVVDLLSPNKAAMAENQVFLISSDSVS